MADHTQDIVIVGSGPSLLGSKLGSEIDSFGTVVRFNQYKVAGKWTTDVGARTDVWVAWALSGRRVEGLREVWQPIIGPVKLGHYTHELERACQKAAVTFSIIPSQFVQSTYESMRLPFHGQEKPTSGMVALTYAISMFGKVWACGFDHFERRKPEHYYSSEAQVPTNPRVNMLAEKRYFTSLLNSGKVITLGGKNGN